MVVTAGLPKCLVHLSDPLRFCELYSGRTGNTHLQSGRMEHGLEISRRRLRSFLHFPWPYRRRGERRPVAVCICSCFPEEAVPIQSTVIILQHPNEESRPLATIPLLRECIPRDKCHIIKGKRFGPGKSELLDKALAAQNTILLYPGRNAVEHTSIPQEPLGVAGDDAALIVLDGTWAQARSIFTQNPRLHSVRQVQLGTGRKSEYVIRTQPTRGCVSTLESVAHALAWLEKNPDIVEVLVRPLRALCQHQLDHGAAVHHNKDEVKKNLQIASSQRREQKGTGNDCDQLT